MDCCPIIKKPLNVKGGIKQATRQDVETIAQFMAGFSEGAYGVTVDPTSQRSAAEGAVERGGMTIHHRSLYDKGHRSYTQAQSTF